MRRKYLSPYAIMYLSHVSLEPLQALILSILILLVELIIELEVSAAPVPR